MGEAVQFRFRKDAPTDQAAVSLGDFLGESNANAVRIEPGEDSRLLLDHLDRIALVEVNFPTYGDGRGFSAARILREAGYTGELRAVGDVLVDRIDAMRRCGFDAFAPNVALDEVDVEAAFNRFPHVYQAAADDRTSIWTLRHG
jgi:uncharacterized protein (DUF934 family)